jgi:hypothetical protein
LPVPTFVALDGEIIAVLAERERRRKRDAQEAARQSVSHVQRRAARRD